MNTQLYFPAILILIGTILVAIGGLLAAHKQNKFESALQNKQEAIETKNEEIILLNQKIGVLSHHTMNLVTGGDSFAYINFSNNESETVDNMQLGSILLTHEGNYPLYDLKIQIHDVESHKDIKVIDVGNIGMTQHIKHFPLSHKINFDLSNKDSQRFNIFFYGRNGMWFQQIIYKKLKTNWTQAIRVVRPNQKNEPVILFKVISKDFPISENDIDWQ